MRFTVRELFACCVLAAALPLLTGARAAAVQPDVEVVAQLYKQFAWEAIIGAPGPNAPLSFNSSLANEEANVLGRYFSQELTALLTADAKCKARTREICKLDFDPIFASQDPSASDLSIERVAPGQIRVAFTYPASQEKVRIEYKVAQQNGKWRISDIVYPSLRNASLVKLLSE